MISYFSPSTSSPSRSEAWVRPNPTSAIHTISSLDEREVYESSRQAEQPAPHAEHSDSGN